MADVFQWEPQFTSHLQNPLPVFHCFIYSVLCDLVSILQSITSAHATWRGHFAIFVICLFQGIVGRRFNDPQLLVCLAYSEF